MRIIDCECTSSIQYLIDYVEDTAPSTNDQDILNTLQSILSLNTLYIPDTINLCCYDCGSYPSILSSVDSFLSFGEGIGLPGNFLEELSCCFSVKANTEQYFKLDEAINIENNRGVVNVCCDLDFNNFINKLLLLLNDHNNVNSILNKGIVLLNNESLQSLFNYLYGKPEQFIVNYLNLILDYGLIIDCKRNIITGINNWMNIYENEIPPSF